MSRSKRAVFELHPENQAPFDVLLALVGVFQYDRKYPDGAPNQHVSTAPGAVRVPESGHTVGGKFLAYWMSHGGVAQQGYPISEEFQEKSDLNGNTYTVQYFQRAVFELHPENAPPNDVLLSQLGTVEYRAETDLSFTDWTGTKVTLPVGLNTLKSQYYDFPTVTMAGVILLTVPVILVFVIFERFIVPSLATTGARKVETSPICGGSSSEARWPRASPLSVVTTIAPRLPKNWSSGGPRWRSRARSLLPIGCCSIPSR